MAFTTTHSGTAQYVITGLTAGSATVTVNSTPVTGSPFTVASGDNSLTFNSTAGTVSITHLIPLRLHIVLAITAAFAILVS
jgi:hypothetical protein